MTVWQDQQPPRSRRAAREMERADLPPQSPEAPETDVFAPATAPFSLASIEGAVSRRALRERTQLSEQPSTYSPETPATPTGRRAQPGEPDRTAESGEPLDYVTQNRGGTPADPADELPPTEALPTQGAPAYRFRDFSPEGRRPQPVFTPPAAPVGNVPTWGAHVAPGANEGQLDYQTDRRAPQPVEPQEHRTLTRRELRALEAQGALAPVLPAPRADEGDQPVASAIPAPSETAGASATPTAEVEALFAPVFDAPAQARIADAAEAAEPAHDDEPAEPESKTGRLFGLFASQSKKAEKAEAAAELAELEEARLQTQRAEAEQVEAARIEAEKAEADRRAAEQRAIEERAEQQRAEAERHAAEAAAMQAAGPATELFDVRADRAAAEREAEQNARAAEREAEERATRARAERTPEPLVEPEEPERRAVPSATDLFAALNADVADERAGRPDSFAEFDFLTSAAASAPEDAPVSVAGLFATPAGPNDEAAGTDDEPEVEQPADSAPTAKIDTAAPYTPPRGHWSIQSDIDELTQPRENISRIIGQGSGGITSNALVLPAIPNTDVMAPVASTGEILITGSFDLPAGLATTGSIPDRLDSEIDHIFDPGDREQPVTDAAPVRAVRAVSSNTSTRGVISAKRPKGSRLPLVLAGSAAFLATSVVGLVIAGWTTGVF
jgi:hypothetical protein